MPISLSGSLNLSGSLTTTGTITATTLVVQTITSSISSITGSTNFGSLVTDTHKFTGSLNVTGAFYVTTGSVGIGTISPSQLFEVVGGEIKAGRVDSSNEGGQVSFGRSTDNATAWYIDAYGNVASPQLRFVNVTNAVVAMTITGSNVGIGTSSPSALLHLNASNIANRGQLTIQSTDYSQITFYKGVTTSTDMVAQIYAASTGNYELNINANQSTGYIVFGAGGGTERMRITSVGDVYMGSSTTNKTSRLVVYGETTDSSQFAIRAFSVGSDVLLGIRNDGLLVTGTLSLSPYNYSVTGRAMYVNSGGVVGYNSSTRESKNNINSLQDISWIHNLNPVTFNKRKKDNEGNYTDEVYDELDYGLIADEVEKVNTDFVFYDTDKDGIKKLAGVGYEKLVPVLVKAIQELTARVQYLENK
jgi:hypothetical protein